jgi:hypothetical protein
MSDEKPKLLSGFTVQFHYVGLTTPAIVPGSTQAAEPAGTPEEQLTACCAQLSAACTNVKAAMTSYLHERYPDSSASAHVDRNAVEMRLARVITAVFDELEQATT